MGEKGLSAVAVDDAWKRLKHRQGEKDTPWQRSGDGYAAFNPETGQNAHWDSDKGQWSDSKTGEALTKPTYK